MASSMLLGLLFLLLQNYSVITQETNGPPKVSGSYIAVGEVLSELEGGKVQSKFDETYDADTGNAALVIFTMGKNVTYIEDNSTSQTLRYSDGECSVINVEEWIKVPAPPSLMGYTDYDGKVRFSLKQLFNISDRYVVPEFAGNETTYRDLPAVSWMYRIESDLTGGNKSTVEIFAFWSNDTWETTSGQGQVPLGYRIARFFMDKTDKKMTLTEQDLNVFSFVHGAVNQKALEPRTGIYCPNRNSSFAFPMLSRAKAISFKSEIIFPDSLEVKTMDVWIDMKNGLLRVDMDRIDNQDPMSEEKRYTSDITSKNLETTYAFDVFKGKVSCKAMNTQSYLMDFQEIINPKLKLSSWSVDTFLSRNSTDWTYLGKTTKRNIPCHLFQGIRKDWPDLDSNIISLWEWCIVTMLSPEPEMMNFRDGEIGLISLQIKFNQKTPILTENKVATIIHHFYDAIEEDPANLDVSTFDISKCFRPDLQRRLEFAVNLKISDDNKTVVENATSDVRFLGAWKTAISEKSNLPLSTLRVAKVNSMVYSNTLLVSFTILGVHDDLRMDIKQKHPTLEEAIHSLNTSIDNNELQIQYSWIKNQKAVPLRALKNTLDYIINDPNEQETFTTSSPGSTVDGGHTTSNSGGTTSNGGQTTPNPDGTKSPLTQASIGHGSGTVAGVSIAMLLVGASMGIGGTYYKYKGMTRLR